MFRGNATMPLCRIPMSRVSDAMLRGNVPRPRSKGSMSLVKRHDVPEQGQDVPGQRPDVPGQFQKVPEQFQNIPVQSPNAPEQFRDVPG
jgi:hypothetical protein